jgi:YgiT-type zinc finger domain-containing protein
MGKEQMSLVTNLESRIDAGNYFFSFNAFEKLIELGLRADEVLNALKQRGVGDINSGGGLENGRIVELEVGSIPIEIEICLIKKLIVHHINDSKKFNCCTSCYSGSGFETKSKPKYLEVQGKSIKLKNVAIESCECGEHYLGKESIEELESRIANKIIT